VGVLLIRHGGRVGWDLVRVSDLYRMVLVDMGFDIDLEWEASHAACLAARAIGARDPIEVLEEIANLFRGKRVYVLGAGPSALRDYRRIERDSHVFCADGACSLLKDLMASAVSVTDLDGGLEPADLVFRVGGYVVVHVHGDNYRYVLSALDHLRKWRERVILTTQVAYPCPGITMIPGFTDGDRAYVLAIALGASDVVPIGMDLDSEYTTHLSKRIYGEMSLAPLPKLRKMRWGLRIVKSLYLQYITHPII